jgi:hypothetical protein
LLLESQTFNKNAIYRKKVKTKSQNKEDKEMTGTQKLVLALLILILTLLFSACSHVTIPRGPIQVKMDVVGSIPISKSISLENEVLESRLTLIGSQGYHKWYADFNVWTSFIVNHLETELRSRGVQVRPDGEDIFKVKVEQVGLYWGSFAIRCIVHVRVEKKDGTWSKIYEGNNSSPATLYRAVDGAVYKAVVAILQDNDFRNALSP